jgi:DNA polymerase-3 subunit alpha (Gram-positive type)
MLDLIAFGIPEKKAFEIMEFIRKGKKISPEDKKMLLQKQVSETYLNACDKIEYLFPKAHAVAYVLMS